jgi:hypothetical protein
MSDTKQIMGTDRLRTMDFEVVLAAMLEFQEHSLREHFRKMWERATQTILARKARTRAVFAVPDFTDFEAKLPHMLAQFERVARAEFISGNLPGDFTFEDALTHVLDTCIKNPSTQLVN